MIVLYITYNSLEDVSSGSGVRPAAMYRAFLERGYDVRLLSGACGRGQATQRRQAVAETVTWLQSNRPDFCYIESSTYPILNHCDYALIRLLHRMNIPTAYFYRDFYRKFPQLYPRRKGAVNKLKELYLDFLQWRTDCVLQNVDLVYFPSKQCFPYFSYRHMKALPPAGEDQFLPPHANQKTCIYVGGLSETYGLPLLLDTFSLLNQGSCRYRLIIVCRKADRETNREKIENIPWLDIYHGSGKELERLYAQADIGLLTLKPNEYTDFSVGTKLFQYISYGLPVLSTNVAAMKELIEANQLGLTAPYDPKAFAAAIHQMLDDPAVLAGYQQRARESLMQKHLWVHRVDQIAQDLLDKSASG